MTKEYTWPMTLSFRLFPLLCGHLCSDIATFLICAILWIFWFFQNSFHLNTPKLLITFEALLLWKLLSHFKTYNNPDVQKLNIFTHRPTDSAVGSLWVWARLTHTHEITLHVAPKGHLACFRYFLWNNNDRILFKYILYILMAWWIHSLL